MRAAEDDGVDLRPRERLEVPANHQPRHVAVEPSLLGERDEERRGLTGHLGARRLARDGARIRARRDGAGRRQHPDASARRRLHRRARARLDDLEHRQVELHPQPLRRHGADGVAGDHQRLHLPGLEMARTRQRVLHDCVGALRPVRDARRVAQVDDVLVRQRRSQRAHDGEATESGVEDAQRTLSHGLPCVRGLRAGARLHRSARALGHPPVGWPILSDEELEHGHADGHAGFDLIEDHAALAVGESGVELHAAVDRAGVHHDGVGLRAREDARS